MRFSLGWYEKAETISQARDNLDAIRLLTYAEFARLFPHASIYRERVMGLTKSYVAYE